MRLNKSLNLVIPIYDETGEHATAYVHATPISADTFDNYYKPIGRVLTQIYSGGYGITAGPRIAHKLLRDVSKEMNIWDGPSGVENGLVAEMHRLTNVLVPGEKGWEMLTFYDAKKKDLIDRDDLQVVEGALAFFCAESSMRPKSQLRSVLEAAAALWGAQISLLTCTEFLNSLPTSTETENTGETATA
jgi:hypothetical protein